MPATPPPNPPAGSNPPPAAPPASQPAATAKKAPPTISQNVASRSVNQLQSILGDAWKDSLSDAERQLAVDMLNDASGLAVASIATGKPLGAEWEQIWAQAAHVTSIKAARFSQALVTALTRGLLGGLGEFVKLNAPYLL